MFINYVLLTHKSEKYYTQKLKKIKISHLSFYVFDDV